MLLKQTGALLLAAGATNAFKNASPFFMLSTELLSGDASSRQIATPSDVERMFGSSTVECAASQYIFVSVPGFDINDANNMPKLAKRVMGNGLYKSRVEVPSVLGGLNMEDLVAMQMKACGQPARSFSSGSTISTEAFDGRNGEEQEIVKFVSESLPQKESTRKSMLAKNDERLDEYLSNVVKNRSHVIIFTSAVSDGEATPAHVDPLYTMDRPYPSALSSMHQDLKRDADMHVRQSNTSDNFQNGLPLFEKYQYLSPGLFMGLTVSILLFMILYVGISAIAGLEVSYGAFSKEMGQQNQKPKSQ